MTRVDWKAWLNEMREEREKNPVETFFMLLLCLLMVVLTGVVFILLVYAFPIPVISTVAVLVILWKLYKRL